MNRHVHRRPDGLLVICRRFWCGGWLDRNVLLHAVRAALAFGGLERHAAPAPARRQRGGLRRA